MSEDPITLFDAWFAEANVVTRFIADTCEKTTVEKMGTTISYRALC